MKQVKAIQEFNFNDRDVVVEDILNLADDSVANELIKAGKVVEIPIEMPGAPPPLPAASPAE